MKTDILSFSSPQFGNIRITTNENGDPIFVANDVCEALGYTNPRKTINDHVEPEDVTKRYTPTQGGNQRLSYINESGLYSLVFGSKLDTAKQFKRWVTSEVLPAIRQHGGYLTPDKIEEALMNPDLIIQMATKLKQERHARELAEARNKTLAPKAEFADRITETPDLVDIGQASKVLDLPFGRNKLFAKLRERGIFFKGRNEPRQEFVERGYFVLKEKLIERQNHPDFVVLKVLVTQKGLAYLSKIFSSNGPQMSLAKFE